MITHIPKVPWKDKLHFVCQFVPLIILRGLAVFAGFFVVPIALLFRKEDPTKAATGGGHHMPFISLPKWAWLWDNDEEGVASHFVPWWEQHDGNANTYWVMLKWSAFRNPANNMRFLKMFRLDMHKCDHEVVDDGFNFYTKSTDRDTGNHTIPLDVESITCLGARMLVILSTSVSRLLEQL